MTARPAPTVRAGGTELYGATPPDVSWCAVRFGTPRAGATVTGFLPDLPGDRSEAPVAVFPVSVGWRSTTGHGRASVLLAVAVPLPGSRPRFRGPGAADVHLRANPDAPRRRRHTGRVGCAGRVEYAGPAEYTRPAEEAGHGIAHAEYVEHGIAHAEYADVLVTGEPLPVEWAHHRVGALMSRYPGSLVAAVPAAGNALVLGVRAAGTGAGAPPVRPIRTVPGLLVPPHVVASVLHAWLVAGGTPEALRSVGPTGPRGRG
ncbi:hypothetical protein [Streptomyces sp. NPDC059398]|uniref:hypothetical protein n=1 Tax=Streptomyces sp. NPDC059398 TaxID=3346820 RepID=UPI0036BA9D83